MTEKYDTIRFSKMLMIGAAGRDAGKTYFATTLLRRFSSAHDIIGIKVTPIERIEQSCPHGRIDCDVCASLKGKFEIVEETDPAPDKDTCKLLAAGAKRVYWLRSLKSHLTEAAAALLDLVGDGKICICESNSLRNIVEPGIFLMLKNKNTKDVKPSSEKVSQHADRLVLFDGANFEVDLDNFALTESGWTLKAKATAIIMAGGQSRRMGRDKSMLPIDTKPMIQHIYQQLVPWFDEILISSNETPKYNFLNIPVIPDRVENQGPLMGIASAMEASKNEANFVIACDMPSVDIPLMQKMLRDSKSFDGIVPRLGKTRYEPLFAVYTKKMLPTINDLLKRGERKIDRTYDLCKMEFIDLSREKILDNINTMQDYLRLSGEEHDIAV